MVADSYGFLSDVEIFSKIAVFYWVLLADALPVPFMSRIVNIKIDRPEPLHELLTEYHSPWDLSEYADTECFARDFACIQTINDASVPFQGILADFFTSRLFQFIRRASDIDMSLLNLVERALRIDFPEPSGERKEVFHLALNAYHRANQRESSYQRWVRQYTMYQTLMLPNDHVLRLYAYLVGSVSAMLMHAGVEIELVGQGGHWRRVAYERFWFHIQEEAIRRDRDAPNWLIHPDDLGLDGRDDDSDHEIDISDNVFGKQRIKPSQPIVEQPPKAKGRKKLQSRASVVKSIRARQGSDECRSEERFERTDMQASTKYQEQVSAAIVDDPKTPERSVEGQQLLKDQHTNNSSLSTGSASERRTEPSSTFSRPRTPDSSATCSTTNHSPLSRKAKEEHKNVYDLQDSEGLNVLVDEEHSPSRQPVDTEDKLVTSEHPRNEVKDNSPEDNESIAIRNKNTASVGTEMTHTLGTSSEKVNSGRRSRRGKDKKPEGTDTETKVAEVISPHEAVLPMQLTVRTVQKIEDEILAEIETMKTDPATVRDLSTLRFRKRTKSMPIFVEYVDGKE